MALPTITVNENPLRSSQELRAAASSSARGLEYGAKGLVNGLQVGSRDIYAIGSGTAGSAARNLGFGNKGSGSNGYSPFNLVNGLTTGARRAVGLGVYTAGVGTGAVADVLKLAGQTIGGSDNYQRGYRSDRSVRRDNSGSKSPISDVSRPGSPTASVRTTEVVRRSGN